MPKPVRPVRRVPCEFCDRKFVDELSRDRHSRAQHRKAFKLVKELRAEMQEMRVSLNYFKMLPVEQ